MKIYKKKTDINIKKTKLFNTLMKSKMMYGETIKKTKSEVLPFLYGTRHNYTIININYTVSLIVRLFKFLKDFKSLNKKILIIGNSLDIQFMINNELYKNNESIVYFNKSWKHGLITNMSVFNKNRDKIVGESIAKKEIQLIIILKSTLHEPILLKELKNINAPIIAITTTSSNLKNVQFPFISSSNNIKALYTLLYVFRKLI
jgi:ribosomal protein S2